MFHCGSDVLKASSTVLFHIRLPDHLLFVSEVRLFAVIAAMDARSFQYSLGSVRARVREHRPV